MTRSHFVKKARKDYPNEGIKKGESYYWWKFNFQKHIFRSKEAPRRSQLTQSDFLGRMWDIEDTISELTTKDDLESEVESIKSELEELRDEQDDKLSNMPDQLQEAPTGQILSGRVESVDEMIGELESVDFEVDEAGIRNDVTEDFLADRNMKATIKAEKAEELPNDEKADLEVQVEEKLDERRQEILDEIQNISYGGE